MENVHVREANRYITDFDEGQWLKMLFLISDIQEWLNDAEHRHFKNIPFKEIKQLRKQTYRLSATAFAHILERHYHRIQRHPAAGKFTIPMVEILNLLREAYQQPAEQIAGTLNLQRIIAADHCIGIDRNHSPTKKITIITNAGGNIITAFPGTLKD